MNKIFEEQIRAIKKLQSQEINSIESLEEEESEDDDDEESNQAVLFNQPEDSDNFFVGDNNSFHVGVNNLSGVQLNLETGS